MGNILTSDSEDPYTTFNLLVRRKGKENNFKAVLATIRDLMNSQSFIPSWMKDAFLGYGNPEATQYYRLETVK